MPPKRRRVRTKQVEPFVHPALEEEEAAAPDITLEQAKNRIKELEEQLRVMSLQNHQGNNSVLVNQTLDPSKVRSKSAVDSPRVKKTRRGSSNVLKKDQNAGCSCSGDCGSKRCGCVKKDKSCSEFCRCTDLCKNQVDRASEDEDDEDKENVQTRKKETKKKVEKNPAPNERVTRNRQVKMMNEDSSSDGTPIRPSKPKSLFNTPEPENRSYSSETSPEEESIINPMKPRHQLPRSPPNKSMNTLNNSELGLDVTVENRSPSPNVSSTNTIVNETNTSLQVNSCKLEVPSPASNPMKPRHKLAHSPIAGPSSDRTTRSKSKSPNLKKNTSGYDDDDVFLSVSMADSSKPIVSPTPPPDIFKEKVDWDQHQSNLVECRKCHRKFFAYRIDTHERSCKKI
ncbi:chromosome-associated kinesin KIF4-like [Cotesia glomerata]|uniref:C2HC/C3H-type domain-containing protein n=1 Tax=Cotesia glomerata TaxID=32391 RepID=A0AAV7J9P4_COTGL|nr:chromosome-associated kinesin KIF4-like [Cotesia glomerata]KAH0568813.1 hypothetical protein KQX54_021508 [Cotesia glomerata]